MLKAEFTADTADALNAQIKDYLSKIKGTRGGKSGEADEGAQTGNLPNAPAPMMPPQGGQVQGFPGTAGFAPPVPGANPAGGFPAAVAPAPGPAPEVLAIAQRIVARIDGAVASGQPVEAVTTWLRGQLAPVEPGAGNFNLDQCKGSLVKLSMPALENVAKLMNA